MNVHAVFFLSYVHIWLPIAFESSFLRVKTSNRFVVKNILEWKRERMLKECLTSECFETVNSYWTLEKDKKNSKHYKTHLNVIESHEKRVIRYIRMQIGGKKRGIKTRVCRKAPWKFLSDMCAQAAHVNECRNQSLKGAQTRRVNIGAVSFSLSRCSTCLIRTSKRAP